MFLMISMHWKRVTRATLNLGDHICKGEVESLQRELDRAQFLLNSFKIRHMFVPKRYKS